MHLVRIIALMLVCALPAGQAPAQDIQIITRDGQKQMLHNPGTPAAGARQPDVTIVEYFDYNCPFCKQLVPEFQALLAQDPKIAIVYKDWAILGEVSKYAARSALAAGYQGKYLAAHDALIGGPRLANTPQVDELLNGAGVNIVKLDKDRTAHAKEIDALLARNDAEAHLLTLDGTPGIVVGRQFVAGIADLPTLQKMVASARHKD